MKGPGGLLEAQALASMPDWPGLYARKVPDPPTRPFRCRCGGQIAPKCDRCGKGHGHPATFTRRHPWDVEVRWVTSRRLHDPICGSVVEASRFELLLECKSTAGPRLSFSVLERQRKDGSKDRSQVEAMRKAAEAGSFAGVLWECRAPLAVTYIPIGVWLGLEQVIGRKSISLDVAAARGIRIEIDSGRGRTRTYYRMDQLLRTLGG